MTRLISHYESSTQLKIDAIQSETMTAKIYDTAVEYLFPVIPGLTPENRIRRIGDIKVVTVVRLVRQYFGSKYHLQPRKRQRNEQTHPVCIYSFFEYILQIHTGSKCVSLAIISMQTISILAIDKSCCHSISRSYFPLD